MDDFIQVNQVRFQYQAADDEVAPGVLNGIDLNVRKGEFIALLGHNGCGKSTLAKHFNAMLLPSEGTVTVDGMNTQEDDLTFDIRRRVGLILQNPDNQLVASIVEEDVAFGPENLGIEPSEIRRRVDAALQAVNMTEYRRHAPHKLSGGQKQRIAIAGILAMLPECIVLDEPTSMLDPRGRREVLETVQKLNREQNITVILITHNMEEAILADRVIVMDHGKAVLEGSPREVFRHVERMRSLRLDVPQTTELIHELRADGYASLSDGILSVEECTDAIAALLEES